MRLPGLGVTVHARQVADSEAAALTQLMVHCASTARSAHARRPRPAALRTRYTDVTGALLPQVTIARDADAPDHHRRAREPCRQYNRW